MTWRANLYHSSKTLREDYKIFLDFSLWFLGRKYLMVQICPSLGGFGSNRLHIMIGYGKMRDGGG